MVWGLCRHVRRRDHEGYVYVVMLTVRDSEHDVLAGLAAGADAYVVKGAPTAAILAQLDVGRRITLLKQSLRAVNRDSRSLSHTDPVTGAHNFGYLTQHLPRELARSQRYATRSRSSNATSTESNECAGSLARPRPMN